RTSSSSFRVYGRAPKERALGSTSAAPRARGELRRADAHRARSRPQLCRYSKGAMTADRSAGLESRARDRRSRRGAPPRRAGQARSPGLPPLGLRAKEKPLPAEVFDNDALCKRRRLQICLLFLSKKLRKFRMA